LAGNVLLSTGTGKPRKDILDEVRTADLLKYYYSQYVDLFASP
jgi:hypothetical protein